MISAAILRTLKYSDHFGFPLTLEEIHLRLASSKPCSLERVFRTLRSMLKKDQIKKTGDYYYFSGHKFLISRRLKRAKLSAPQLVRAKSLALRLSHVPGVQAIYLTGSLAMHNSDLGSDIDFMVITQNGRLWTTRFLLTLSTSLLGLRRTPNSTHNSGKVCLNLYLTPRSYLIPKEKQSLYTAYELMQAVPLCDPSDTHTQILAANSWIKKYLPNAPSRPGLEGLNNAPSRPGLMGNLIESILYHLQLAYMRPKLTREYITKDSAFFHPNDPGAKVLQELEV